jgi:predicted dehydrogenase
MARESNVICMVGNEHHYHPVMLSSIHEIQLPLFIETQQLTTFNPSNPSVDVVSSLMMQDIQTVLRLVNSEIKHISASGVKVLSDTIDIANARLEFTNGTLANLTSSRISQKQMHLSRVFQKDCYHVLNFHQNQADKIYLDTTLPHQVALQAETKTIPTRSPYQGLLDDFQLSIKQQKNLGMRLDQSRKAQEICDTILKKINFLGDE